jgi:methyl-accepting chemotaxis protein
VKFTIRLTVMAAIAVIAFGSVSLLSQQMRAQFTSFGSDIHRLDEMTSLIWRLQSLSYQVYVGDYVDVSYRQWDTTVGELRASLEEFVAADSTSRLAARNPDYAEEVERVEAVAQLVDDEIEEYRAALATITQDFSEFPTWSLVHVEYTEGLWDVTIFARTVESLTTALDETLSNVVRRLIASLNQIQERVVATVQRLFAAVQIVAVAAIVGLILWFRRSLRRKFISIHEATERLAAGDFTVELETTGGDELSAMSGFVQEFVDAFSGVVSNIKEIASRATELRTEMVGAAQESEASVTEIIGNITSISGTVRDLDSTIEKTEELLRLVHRAITELESKTGEQTQAVAESSSAVEEMTASIANVTKIAGERQDAANRLRAVSEEGRENIETTDGNVAAIAGSVEEILGIITVINGIASQTSVLAMNAAIEAAHAGEYGRGFAVVAEEIRKLSGSTNENAKRIQEQLEQVATLVGETHSMSAKTMESFGAILKEVESTAQAFDEINATMKELSAGTESVMNSSVRVGEVTRTIGEEVTRVTGQSHGITESMEHVRDISSVVRTGMQEINVGATEINTTLNHMTKVAQDTYDNVGQLHESVVAFRVDEEPAIAGEPTPMDADSEQ